MRHCGAGSALWMGLEPAWSIFPTGLRPALSVVRTFGADRAEMHLKLGAASEKATGRCPRDRLRASDAAARPYISVEIWACCAAWPFPSGGERWHLVGNRPYPSRSTGRGDARSFCVPATLTRKDCLDSSKSDECRDCSKQAGRPRKSQDGGFDFQGNRRTLVLMIPLFHLQMCPFQ